MISSSSSRLLSPASRARQLWASPLQSRLLRPGGPPRSPRSLTAAALASRVQPRLWGRRWESTTVGSQSSGHIVPGANEAILYFDNIFPLGLSSSIFWRQWQAEKDVSDLLRKFENSSLGIADPISMVKRAIPSGLPIKVTEIIPRLKDGGAFVKFSYGSETSPAEVEGALARSLQESPVKPWYNPFASMKVRLVQGVPWLEDLHRFPKGRLKVDFCPPAPGESSAVELSQETLYGLFRRYGKIAEISPQPFDSKVTPRYANVDFVLVRDAIMARNCMHGFTVGEALGGGRNGTKLSLSYQARVKPHHIWDWITNHPRIVIPLAAALLAAITVAVFDPMREFFIRIHVQRSFRLTNSRLYRWFKRQTDDIFASRRRRKEDQAGLQALWSQRKDIIDSVQTWLMETADTFIVVQGPRGSGTKQLVTEQALKGRNNVLVVDCKPVVDARGESATIRKLAVEVGYRPVFSWLNSASSMIDLAIQGTTGVKSGFSETLESQIAKILASTASALKQVSLADRKKDGDAKDDASLSEDAYLEAHPERRPVVVIDNFLHRHEDGGLVYDKIAEWAAALVQANIAHVIFLTNDTSYSKSLSKSLPDRVFRQVSLGDLSPAVAKQYVLSHLEGLDRASPVDDGEDAEKRSEQQQKPRTASATAPDGGGASRQNILAELDGCIDTLGGRLADLEFLARRLKSGQTPSRAVAEIVEQSSSEILKMFILARNHQSAGTSDGTGAAGDRRAWSAEQAWYLVKEIAAKGSLRYNEVLLSGTFASSTTSAASDGEAAVEALAAAELVTVTSHRGRPQTIHAGRPVYQAAFGMLAADPVLRARLDLALLTELAKVEAKGIDKVEAELALLGSLPKQPRETTDRVNYLLAKLQAGQSKIVAMEKDMAALKQVLMRDP